MFHAFQMQRTELSDYDAEATDDENVYYIMIHTSEDDTDSIIIKEDVRDDSEEE